MQYACYTIFSYLYLEGLGIAGIFLYRRISFVFCRYPFQQIQNVESVEERNQFPSDTQPDPAVKTAADVLFSTMRLQE